MSASQNRILTKMLDRLFAGLLSGPNMNCRPHASRQRVDWIQLQKFDDIAPAAALGRLLGDGREVKLTARVPMPPSLGRKSNGPRRGRKFDAPVREVSAEVNRTDGSAAGEIELTPEEKAAEEAWRDQQSLIGKLRIFPRRPLFDIVIFDEASQCRLEEALPVLTRAKRVVIAGDPKQLPPTRFFETALATSDEEEAETDQELFERHQDEIEDLLGAALSIDVEQCYLDVHYRSRNSDLIEFSNEQFYSSRLQPIPGHPNNRARFAPITLYRANGIYDKRTNPAEADAVCRIVTDLLKRAEPPSIGIACFNIAQRDLIVERLDELAAEDDEFARRLAEARTRRGTGSFEGLFVKNLENVQGDERDHIIISTTYGPDPKGRFYRRFGPVGRQGGGRRLNVLVTRAREEVHLVTSIPADVYRNVPPVPAGQTPGGGWLLFAYLAFAERLAEQYEAAHAAIVAAEKAKTATTHVRSSRAPSVFAAEFADHLAAQHKVSSDVHWGNDGFCVDVALHHPTRVDSVTVGVLCDGTRFAQAEDPIEWDAFRVAILESQSWQLHRLWTPHFFRDRAGCTKRILREVAELVATEDDKDGLKVK